MNEMEHYWFGTIAAALISTSVTIGVAIAIIEAHL